MVPDYPPKFICENAKAGCHATRLQACAAQIIDEYKFFYLIFSDNTKKLNGLFVWN